MLRTAKPFHLGLVLVVMLLLSACATVGALLSNQVSFTQVQLQQQLDRRFPRNYSQLGGLAQVRVINPRISIPSGGGQRLQLAFDVAVGGPGQSPSNTPAGQFVVSSGLRFDREKRGLMLDAPSLDQLNVAGLGSSGQRTARELVNLWLTDWARNEPVYQFDDSLMQRLAAQRVGRTSIGDGVITLHLDQ